MFTNLQTASAENDPFAILLRLLLDATQDGVMDWHTAERIVEYNPRWFHLFGFDGDELHDTPSPGLWLSLVHPDDLPLAKSQLQDHLESGWPLATTLRMAHRAGGYRYTLCRGTTLRDENDVPLRTVIVFSTVDEHVRGEERQRALLEALPDTVVRFNEAGIVTGFKLGRESPNSPLRRLAEGADVKQCPIFTEKTVALLMKIAAGTSGESPELRVSHGTLHYEVRASSSSSEEIVCIVRDITAQRELEAHLLESQKLGAIGQLSAGVAHEINTPMQFIGDNLFFSKDAVADLLKLVGRLREIAETSDDGSANSEAIAEAEAEADLEYLHEALPRGIERSLMGVERVTKIVRALKCFAHPDAGGFVPTDLRELLESTATVATNEWKYVADLEISIDETLPPIECVPGELSQAFLNLIVNAAHAIGDVVGNAGGKGRITILGTHSGESIEVRISDTGTGIPEHVLPRIFEQFFTTKDVGKGTGMGLPMVYSCITKRHNGSVNVETVAGKGTTFVLVLPKTQPHLSLRPSAIPA